MWFEPIATLKGDNDEHNGGENHDWVKGVVLSIASAVVCGISKLLIRKSWLLTDAPFVSEDEDIGEEEEEHETSGYRPLLLTPSDETTSAAASSGVVDSFPDRCCRCVTIPSLRRSRRDRRCRRYPLFLRVSGIVGLSVLHPVLALSAVRYATPSLLVPFAGLSLVTVVVLEGPVSGEWPSSRRVSASAAVVLGGLLVALFGDRRNADDAETVLCDWRRDAVTIALACATVVWLGSLAVVAVRSEDDRSRRRRAAWGLWCGTVLGWNTIVVKDTATALAAPRGEVPPAVAGALATASVLLFVAGVSSLVVCMRRWDATSSSSFIVGAVVVSSSVASAAHYDTFAHLTKAYAAGYSVGLTLVLTGLCFMNATPAVAIDKENEEEDVDGGNEGPKISRA